METEMKDELQVILPRQVWDTLLELINPITDDGRMPTDFYADITSAKIAISNAFTNAKDM